MNKKIVLLAGVAALALNVNAIPVVVPAPNCAGAVIWQQQHAAELRAEHPAKHDGTNPNSVLWYVCSVIALLILLGISELVFEW